MSKLLYPLAALMLFVSPILADTPATNPSDLPSTPLVLVYPFQGVGQIKGHEWVSSALKEDFVAELGKTGAVQTKVMPDAIDSSDSARAIAAAKDAGASLVLF